MISNILSVTKQPQEKKFNTLAEVLFYWAIKQPGNKAYTLLDSHGNEHDSITYGDLYSQAINLAQHLLSLGLKSHNVILLYPTGIEFMVAFFGCILAGVYPAPIQAPKRNRSNQKIALMGISSNISAVLCLDTELNSYKEVLTREEMWSKDINFIATNNIENSLVAVKNWVDFKGADLAFLQYTSGSTSLPKGVMISHGNCISNLEMAIAVSGANSDSTFVSWLPHHHDLGLVAHLLHSFYAGSHCVILAPNTFISKPHLWLKAITKYRAQYTGAPNFAYQLCVDRIQLFEQQTLELSSLKMAINAAEPVNPKTIEDFCKKFARNGFTSEMFLPAFGMAEATVFISSGNIHDQPVFKTFDWDLLSKNIAVAVTSDGKKKVLVGCGQAKIEEKICIVEPESKEILPSNNVGEIWVSGPNVMMGYYNNEEATKETLVSLGDRSYLRTGDLGFIDENEDLFITGRIKDMMIFHGVNYYPQDIENCLENAHPDIQEGSVIAFSQPNINGEELVIFVELTKNGMNNLNKKNGYFEELQKSIFSSLTNNGFDLEINQILLLGVRQIPKTTSGKKQRQKCKQELESFKSTALKYWNRHGTA